MATAFGIICVILIFPLLVYAFVFDRIPLLSTLLSPLLSRRINVKAIKAAALRRRRPDSYGDEDRPIWSPSSLEQLETRTLLLRLLPPELVLDILFLASYHTLTGSTQSVRQWVVTQRSRPYLVSSPIPKGGRLEEIRIAIKSKDQGWSSYPEDYGTYNNSNSFFQAFLLRPTVIPPAPETSRSNPWSFSLSSSMDGTLKASVDMEVAKSREIIQFNVHAGQFLKNHIISIRRDRPPFVNSFPLIREAQPGDRVILEATARYPGWENRVAAARIDVFVSYYHGPPELRF
ncbi:hypothetical protein BDY24DRAFT_400616 [Mrakia frigida]|uniref:uncharacterized protein n=1 Tax=Mrakia frigida TaxID=29902 RepID=UPI003FCC25F6